MTPEEIAARNFLGWVRLQVAQDRAKDFLATSEPKTFLSVVLAKEMLRIDTRALLLTILKDDA
jgi:hypothetical protein